LKALLQDRQDPEGSASGSHDTGNWARARSLVSAREVAAVGTLDLVERTLIHVARYFLYSCVMVVMLRSLAWFARMRETCRSNASASVGPAIRRVLGGWQEGAVEEAHRHQEGETGWSAHVGPIVIDDDCYDTPQIPAR